MRRGAFGVQVVVPAALPVEVCLAVVLVEVDRCRSRTAHRRHSSAGTPLPGDRRARHRCSRTRPRSWAAYPRSGRPHRRRPCQPCIRRGLARRFPGRRTAHPTRSQRPRYQWSGPRNSRRYGSRSRRRCGGSCIPRTGRRTHRSPSRTPVRSSTCRYRRCRIRTGRRRCSSTDTALRSWDIAAVGVGVLIP